MRTNVLFYVASVVFAAGLVLGGSAEAAKEQSFSLELIDPKGANKKK